MRKWKMVLIGIAFLMLGGIAAGCSRSVEMSAGEQMTTLPKSKHLQAAFTDARLSAMKGIVDNGSLRLFIDETTAEIAVVDKRSSEIWRSNPEDRESDTIATGVNRDMLSAQSRISFYNSLGQSSSVNTFSDSAALGQVAYEPIENGIRVTYQFGKYEPSVDDMPKMLSKERLEEITSKLEAGGKRALVIAYREDKETGLYSRNDGSLKGLQLQRALEAFRLAGYTEEDLERDIAELSLDQTRPTPRIFMMAIEYTLDGNTLVAKIPSSSIHHSPNYPINQVTVLNYFGAGSAKEQGSLFVPDGSGALIHFNNGKSTYPVYQQEVYGRDLTNDKTDYLVRDQKIRLPVFGIIKERGAFLGVIEQGAASALINADVNGRLNSYNFVYPTFYYRHKDDVTLNAGSQQRSLPKFQEKPMETDYVVRYAFLSGDEASYEGMARYYQRYLADRELLAPPAPTAGSADENIPFYLQLIGSINTQKHMLGIPYRAQLPLTTLEEAQTIVSELQERQISNVRIQYSGWFNGGVGQAVPSKVKVDSAIGGASGLERFRAFAKQSGVSFFPDVALLNFSNTDGLSTSGDASRRLTGDPAYIYPLDQALNRRDRTRTPAYLLSPAKLGKVTEGLLGGLQRLQMDSISLRDLGDQLNSDFRKGKTVDRVETEAVATAALRSIQSSGLRIMVDGGNAYALPYATDVTNVPMSNSGFKLEDEAIPFYQMVVRGYSDYTGSPYNLSTYTNPRQYLLKCLEYGAHPYFTWTYEQNAAVKETEYDYFYSVQYKEWIDLAQQLYGEMNEVMKQAQGKGIVSHEKLADGVYKTGYENGFYVIVNYNAAPVTAGGVTIEAEGFTTGGERS